MLINFFIIYFYVMLFSSRINYYFITIVLIFFTLQHKYA